MNDSLRIVAAADDSDQRDYFRGILPLMGHTAVGIVETGHEVVEACSHHKPDLVILDIKMPDMEAHEALSRIYRDIPVPAILVSPFHHDKLIVRVEDDFILAYLLKPIRLYDLERAISLVFRRFGEFQILCHEATDFRQALEDRKLVERAKGVMMDFAGFREADAFRRLKKVASEHDRKTVDIAKIVLMGAEELQKPISMTDG